MANIVPFGERKLGPFLSQLICDHIALLSADSERYFPNASNPRTDKSWVRDPFANVPRKSSMLVREEPQLIEIANNSSLKNMFQTSSLAGF